MTGVKEKNFYVLYGDPNADTRRFQVFINLSCQESVDFFLFSFLPVLCMCLTMYTTVPSRDSTCSLLYEGCPESIQPFWISREPVEWSWCNLEAIMRRPYCASVNSHSPVGLVSRQWDAVDWACVLCDSRIHKYPPFQRRFYLWEKPEFAGSQI